MYITQCSNIERGAILLETGESWQRLVATVSPTLTVSKGCALPLHDDHHHDYDHRHDHHHHYDHHYDDHNHHAKNHGKD